jgi:hypothetical protein
MYEKPIFKVVALIVLVAFIVVSCSSPVIDDGSPIDSTPTVPIGKGTPCFVYLNADYEQVEEDSGRTMLFIEDNEAAEGVAVIAEVPDNNLDKGSIVRVVNNNNNSVVSFFFHKNQIFPYQMVMQSQEGIVTGNFSLYDPTAEQYSVLFEKEGKSEKCELKGLNLNKDIFNVYVHDDGLNASQNLRLKNTVTALAVRDSIALQIPEDDFTVKGTGMYVASWWNPVSWFTSAVKYVVQNLPVIVLVAAIIVCAPIAITLVATALTIEPIAIVVATALVAAPLVEAIADGLGNCPGGPPPSPPPFVPVSVTVTQIVDRFASKAMLGNMALEPVKMSIIDPYFRYGVQNNNSEPYDLITVGSKLLFDFQFYGGYPVDQDTSPWMNLFDPVASRFSYFEDIISISKSVTAADHCTLTVTKGDEGYIRQGAAQAIIRFGYDMTINGTDAGVDFVSDTDTSVSQHRKDVFIININTKPPEEV